MTSKPSIIFNTEEYANFAAEVHTILLLKTDGLSEYELLDEIKQLPRFSFMDKIFQSNLSLFHSHFILFHCLYKLRQYLLEQELNYLEISALSIQLRPFITKPKQSTGIEIPDPLQEYYLDKKQLDDQNELNLTNMIDNFWQSLIANDERPKALSTLGLNDPINNDQIKKAWRKLVMQHHPDRGGDSNTLQSINKAFNILMS